jgi:hypothetical protein
MVEYTSQFFHSVILKEQFITYLSAIIINMVFELSTFCYQILTAQETLLIQLRLML